MSRQPYSRDALLAAARRAQGPDASTTEQLWDRLEQDGLTDPVPTTSAAAPWRWIAVAAAVVAAAFVLGWWLRGAPMRAVATEQPRDMASREATQVAHGGQATPRAPHDSGATASAQPPAVAAPTPLAEPAPGLRPTAPAQSPRAAPNAAPARAPARRNAAPAPTADSPPPTPTATPDPPAPVVVDTLAAEALAVQRARKALSQGKPSEAQALVAAYRRQYTTPKLAEEADAIDTIARCRLVPDLGAKLRDDFAGQYPGSLQQAGVDRACAPR